MSIALRCSTCGDFVGVTEAVCFNQQTDVWCDCHGSGTHPKPIRTEEKKLFGLIRQVTQTYPETDTNSSWSEYVGPPKKSWLWFAIVFGTKRWPDGSYDGVTVNRQWVWWNPKIGLYGDGVSELKNLQKK